MASMLYQRNKWKLFWVERVKRSLYGKESLLMHILYSVNYRSKARRGAPTMNNEITPPKICMESDILTISF